VGEEEGDQKGMNRPKYFEEGNIFFHKNTWRLVD
jgi:hypothetical protein